MRPSSQMKSLFWLIFLQLMLLVDETVAMMVKSKHNVHGVSIIRNQKASIKHATRSIARHPTTKLKRIWASSRHHFESYQARLKELEYFYDKAHVVHDNIVTILQENKNGIELKVQKIHVIIYSTGLFSDKELILNWANMKELGDDLDTYNSLYHITTFNPRDIEGMMSHVNSRMLLFETMLDRRDHDVKVIEEVSEVYNDLQRRLSDYPCYVDLYNVFNSQPTGNFEGIFVTARDIIRLHNKEQCSYDEQLASHVLHSIERMRSLLQTSKVGRYHYWKRDVRQLLFPFVAQAFYTNSQKHWHYALEWLLEALFNCFDGAQVFHYEIRSCDNDQYVMKYNAIQNLLHHSDNLKQYEVVEEFARSFI
ncbi:hypothetical protein MP638_006325 [Amoeboaphelidium occidentale]|nr:hypothetical protein MP638_006325 [Amoeboaphelidium occidentale]